MTATTTTRTEVRKMSKADLASFVSDHGENTEGLSRKELVEVALRALDSFDAGEPAAEAPAEPERQDTVKAVRAKVAAKAKADAKPAPDAAAKPRTDARGMLLDRVGHVEDTGDLVGYVVKRPYPTNEVLAHPDKAKAKAEGKPVYVTRCVAHGFTTPAATATEAENLGVKHKRPEWCPMCAQDAQ